MAPFGSAADDSDAKSPANSPAAALAGSAGSATPNQVSPLNRMRTTSPSTSATQPGVGHSACTCDGARPVVPDPLTGQPVCACQLELSGNPAGSLGLGRAQPALGPSSTGPLGLYHPYHIGAHHELPPPPPPPFLTGPDQSAFYAAATPGLELNAAAVAAAASGWPYPSMYYPYDPALAGYPFGGYGMDLNGSRRKNATRETTATLKAWLSEHKKNPYPTKGEKIMLAIITKMTLTQVSTWFANARRRLKKENKMTWEPKNRNDGDDDDDDGDDASDPGEKEANKRLDGWSESNHALHRLQHHDEARTGDSEDNIDVMLDSDEEELDLLSSGGDSTCLSPGVSAATPAASVAATTAATTTAAATKPKIWSLADMAGNQQPSHAPVQHGTQQPFGAGLAFGPLGQPFALRGAPFLAPNNNNNVNSAPAGGGKMFSTFAPSRLPASYLDTSPYARPSVPTSSALTTPYRYPGAPQPAPPFAQRPGESVALAYNQLMSSMAAHLQQQQQQHGKPSNPGVLENLEKLAALASGAAPAAK